MLDDLKACQKYASVDLVKYHAEQHQHLKYLHWEVDFLKALQDLDLHKERVYARGEGLYRAGEVADKVYLLVQGTVLLARDRMESTLFHPTNLLGAEALQPNGQYALTATAELDTKCLVFSQSDIVHGMVAELSGAMLRLAFKSSAAIDAALIEARKRRRASSRSMSVTSLSSHSPS